MPDSPLPNWKSLTFAQVDGLSITLEYFVNSLRIHRQLGIFEDVIRRAVIETLFDEHDISVSDDDIGDFQIALRENLELYDEASTIKWLQQHHLSDEDFWNYCTFQTKLKALKEAIVADSVEERFSLQKVELDQVELLHLIAESDALAREIKLLVAEGEEFSILAQRVSLEPETRNQGGYMGFLWRRQLSAEVEVAAFTAEPLAVVGPFKGIRGHHLYQVKSIKRAVLDDSTRSLVVDELFQEFLRRHMAGKQVKVSLLDRIPGIRA